MKKARLTTVVVTGEEGYAGRVESILGILNFLEALDA